MGCIPDKATPVTVVSQGAHIREDLRGDVLRMPTHTEPGPREVTSFERTLLIYLVGGQFTLLTEDQLLHVI